MHLKKIALLNFKNMAQEELTLCPGINCLVGDNGAGKTNVVDAVYYLSMCKSSLQMTDAQSIRHGADFFLVEGQYATDAGKSEGVVCSFSRKGGKVLKRNGKEYERLSDHVGLIPAVIVSPADSALISDAADERRRYLNGFISQLDRTYLAAVMRYNGVLAAFLILGFYFVVSGWTAEYMVHSVTGSIARFSTAEQYKSLFENFISNPWRPVVYTCLFVLATHFVLSLIHISEPTRPY